MLVVLLYVVQPNFSAQIFPNASTELPKVKPSSVFAIRIPSDNQQDDHDFIGKTDAENFPLCVVPTPPLPPSPHPNLLLVLGNPPGLLEGPCRVCNRQPCIILGNVLNLSKLLSGIGHVKSSYCHIVRAIEALASI